MSQEEAEEHNDLTLPPGYGLGVYTIQKSLGQGGFGITYLAYDTSLDTEVVIKESMPSMFAGRSADSHQVFTLSRSSEDFAWALDRFLMEARTLAKLNHRNIVRVMRVFEALGTAYYVMPYLGGSSLDKVLEKEGPLPEKRITALLASLLDALAYLHSKNLLHRDIKPANILLDTDGEPILIDFGAARTLSQHSQTVVESPGYTPFEQIQTRGNLGPWTDLYALGGTMYKLITGKTPVRSTDRVGGDTQPRLATNAELCKRYSKDLLAGIDKALAFSPTKRWQSAGEWREHMQGGSGTIAKRPASRLRTAAGPLSTAKPGTAVPPRAEASAPATTAPRKRRGLLWGGIAAVLALAAGATWFLMPAPDARECFKRAENYYNGRGVEQNYQEAAKWYRRAAEQGLADAQLALGTMYEIGQGVAQGEKEAVAWYRQAAEQSLPDAQQLLGNMYANGKGVSKSDGEAVNWYRKAADQRYARGQNCLGVMYQEGRGISKNDREAVDLYRKSAEQGYAAAQNNLGSMYRSGRGVSQDAREAVKWYRKAADQGLADAQNSLGIMCATGRGCSQNDREAFEWFSKAAEQGHAAAQNNLAVMYQDGRGTDKNNEVAVLWYKRAAAQGNAAAQKALTRMGESISN